MKETLRNYVNDPTTPGILNNPNQTVKLGGD